MNTWKKVRVKDFLTRVKIPVVIESGSTYKRVTIRMYHKGVILRDVVAGSKIGTKTLYRVKEGQFILSGIDARNAAFGIVPEDLDNAVVSNDFWVFEINKQLVNVNFFYWLTRTPQFLDICKRASLGTTNRQRIQSSLFYNFDINIPSLPEQMNLVKRLSNMDSLSKSLEVEIFDLTSNIYNLKQSIILDAIQGKLLTHKKTAQAINMKEEAYRSLSTIEDKDFPYSIPQGWKWCRLGDVVTIKGGKRLPLGHQLTREDTGHIYVRVTDMKKGTIDDSDLHFISEGTYQTIKNYFIGKDDLYLVIVGSTIGKSGTVPQKFDKMNLTENAVKISPVLVDREYLNITLKTSFLQKQFYDRVNRLGQPKLAIKRIKTSLFPLPTIGEQKRIVEEVNRLIKLCAELEEETKKSQEHTDLLMYTQLQEVFQKQTLRV